MGVRKIKNTPPVYINKAWCKGCGICAVLCPAKVLALDSRKKAAVVNPTACTGCENCVWHCPDFAIDLGGR